MFFLKLYLNLRVPGQSWIEVYLHCNSASQTVLLIQLLVTNSIWIIHLRFQSFLLEIQWSPKSQYPVDIKGNVALFVKLNWRNMILLNKSKITIQYFKIDTLENVTTSWLPLKIWVLFFHYEENVPALCSVYLKFAINLVIKQYECTWWWHSPLVIDSTFLWLPIVHFYGYW